MRECSFEWTGILAEVEFQHIIQERNHLGKKGLALEVATWLDLLKKRSWKRTAVGCGAAFFQQFSGINGFIYYAPSLFRSLGQSNEMSLILSGTLNILQLVAVVICFFIIDRVGRRPLAVYGGFGMVIPYVIMAILVGLYDKSWRTHVGAGWATTAMAHIYILVYGVSYSPLGWALPPEVFPNSSRAKGVALSTATVWLSNFIVGVAVPPMIQQAGFGTYAFFAIMCLLAGLRAYFLVPETKGKSLEQMDEVFGDSNVKEEKEVMKQAAGYARRESIARRESLGFRDLKV